MWRYIVWAVCAWFGAAPTIAASGRQARRVRRRSRISRIAISPADSPSPTAEDPRKVVASLGDRVAKVMEDEGIGMKEMLEVLEVDAAHGYLTLTCRSRRTIASVTGSPSGPCAGNRSPVCT